MMTWGLKLTDAGWRISGMAAHLGPDRPPVVVDFENPGQLAGLQNSQTPTQNQQQAPQRQAMQPSEDPFRQTVPR